MNCVLHSLRYLHTHFVAIRAAGGCRAKASKVCYRNWPVVTETGALKTTPKLRRGVTETSLGALRKRHQGVTETTFRERETTPNNLKARAIWSHCPKHSEGASHLVALPQTILRRELFGHTAPNTLKARAIWSHCPKQS